MTADKRQKKFPNLKAGRGEATGTKSVKYPSSRTAGLKRGGGPGRPKGVPNKVTREAKDFAESVLHSPLVQARILYDAERGRLPPPVLTILMSYAWGKPKETIRHEGLERLLVEVTDRVDEPAEPTADS